MSLTIAQLKVALKQACQEGLLARNPAKYVKMPKVARRERPTWSENELRAFARVAAADRLAACWRLSLLGMRRGELLGLRWSDVDLTPAGGAGYGAVTIGNARVLVYGRRSRSRPSPSAGGGSCRCPTPTRPPR